MPKTINLCVITRYFYPTITGSGERFRRYGAKLRDYDIQMSIITARVEGAADFEVIDGIPVYRFPVGKRPYASLFKQAVNHFRTTKQWPDVVQTLNSVPGVLPYLLLLKRRGIPCLWVSTLMILPSRQPTNWISRLHIWLYKRLSWHYYDRIFAGSTTMAQNLVEQGLPDDRISVIPHGTDTRRFHPPDSPEARCDGRQPLGLDSGGKIILYVGNMSPRKGIDIILAAWPQIIQQIPDAYLLLVGPRKNSAQFESFFRQIDQMVAGFDAADRIVFTGSVDNVEDYMRAADVFVFPSELEGMPNAVVEAMASGLPCVLSAFEGLSPELGTPGVHYVLVERQSPALAQALTQLLSDEPQRRQLGQAARQHIEQHLDSDASVASWAQWYRHCVQDS